VLPSVILAVWAPKAVPVPITRVNCVAVPNVHDAARNQIVPVPTKAVHPPEVGKLLPVTATVPPMYALDGESEVMLCMCTTVGPSSNQYNNKV
jgi:hypothetical protein